MAAYARQAKDQELILWATEIKVRAERRAGEMLTSMARNGERAKQGDGPKFDPENSSIEELSKDRPKTLEDLGVSKRESHRWQSLASMSEEHFETAVAMPKQSDCKILQGSRPTAIAKRGDVVQISTSMN